MRIASSSRSVPSASALAVYSGGLEAHLHVALRREIVDLVRLDFLDQANEVGRIGEIAEMEKELDARLMRIRIEMIDAAGIERRRAPLHAVDRVALGEQELGKIRAILTGGAGDQCNLVGHQPLSDRPAAIKRVTACAGQHFRQRPRRGSGPPPARRRGTP